MPRFNATSWAREAVERLSSPAALLAHARNEVIAVFGPQIALRSVPATTEIRVYFHHASTWFVALPISPDQWVIDITHTVEQACTEPAFTDRASAMCARLGWDHAYVAQLARVAVGAEPAGSEVDFAVPLETVSFVATRGGNGEIEVDLDMQHVGSGQ